MCVCGWCVDIYYIYMKNGQKENVVELKLWLVAILKCLFVSGIRKKKQQQIYVWNVCAILMHYLI